MIDKKMEQAFNEQINAEFFSEYLYLSMKAYFADLNLPGFVNWLSVQVQEEHAHGMGMFDYLIQRGGTVELMEIAKPDKCWASPVECFRKISEHEQLVTSLINKRMDVAEEVKDRAAMHFLDWYLKEQVEEEDSVCGVLRTLELIGDDKHALLMLDRELATRTFTQPVIG